MLHYARYTLQIHGQLLRLVDRADEVCDHPPIGTRRHISQTNLTVPPLHQSPESRLEPESEELEGHRGMELVDELARIGYYDEPVHGGSNKLLPGLCGSPRPSRANREDRSGLAPSIAMSSRSTVKGSTEVYRACQLRALLRGDVETHLKSRFLLARAGRRYEDQVVPVPSPTLIPFSTNEAAASADKRFSVSACSFTAASVAHLQLRMGHEVHCAQTHP